MNTQRKTDGITPLIMAALNGHIKIVKLLVEANADINAKNTSGVTALMAATQNGHTAIAELLREYGAKE